MATSGVYSKTYTTDYIIRRATDVAGGQPMSGSDLEDSIDMLNELLMEMSNKEHPLSRIKQKSVAVSASVAGYDLGPSITAVYDSVMTWSSVDYAMNEMNRYDYFNIPNKDTEGKPSQFMVEQTLNSVNMYLYPVPSQNDTIKFYAAIRPQILTNMQQELDVHPRYIPSVIMGLAYKMSFGRRGIDPTYRLELLQNYKELFMEAAEEDKERVDWFISLGY